ncbi:hypothetical protein ACFV5K_41465, partial [Streptomyces sp. NPDC059744]
YYPEYKASRLLVFGMVVGDSTLWVSAAEELPEAGEWLGAPFDEADPQLVVCRFDVSSVFDEDDLDEELDDLAAESS